jgi:hypothetical protein
MKTYNEGCGWVLKAPFVTNSQHFFYFISDPEEVLWRLQLVSAAVYDAKSCYVIPYMMLQPRMQNRKEYKVVLLDGKASHIAVVNKSHRGSIAYSSHPHSRLFAFAESAVSMLKNAKPYAILDGLVRVDVFETQEKEIMVDKNGNEITQKRWVINEFESIEAQFTSNARNDAFVYSFLYDYWFAKISSVLKTLKKYVRINEVENIFNLNNFFRIETMFTKLSFI